MDPNPKSEKYLSVPLERDVILTSGSVKGIVRFDHSIDLTPVIICICFVQLFKNEL